MTIGTSTPAYFLSPAKINLILKVTGKRKDGYHNIATLFQMVGLYDKLTFAPDTGGKVTVACNVPGMEEKDNIVYKAAMSLWKPGCKGVSIRIEKNIPVSAGLGGGSSNAATALAVLNRFWGLGLSGARLATKAKNLGADVPFFLSAPRAWATGIGERLTPLPNCEKFHILLVNPGISVPTVEIYRHLPPELTTKPGIIKIPRRIREYISYEDTVDFLENDLERTVELRYPLVTLVKKELGRYAQKGVMVSGSGATVFALFKSKNEADAAIKGMKQIGWWCSLVEPLDSMGHLENAFR
ncbi:MAG: 4-(cytidine 5'-diphospho)-2-C-methyl-D-erythritol kinase [Nitrospinota bacterium]|nr:4-(cytidine 5'-diphospho)-2-C-methyl-D-erythritol kinase [Nitrospinota bacterium]